MTHATRFAAVAVLVALVGAPVQAQTLELDAQRVRAEAGDASAQGNLGYMYETGRGVRRQNYVQAHM
jgi:TPR repeat protein